MSSSKPTILQDFINQLGGLHNGGYWPASTTSQSYSSYPASSSSPGGTVTFSSPIQNSFSGALSSSGTSQTVSEAQYQAYLRAAQQFGMIQQHQLLVRPPYKPLKTETIVPGEIIAWRCWQVMDSRLRSMVMNNPWEPGEPMTGKPGKDYSEGVHAFKTYEEMAGQYSYGFVAESYDIVYGQVALWGDVIEHDKGYRAEYGKPLSLAWAHPGKAKPKGLWLGNNDRQKKLEDLRKLYKVGEPPSQQPTS